MKKNVKLCFVLTILLLGFFQAQATKWKGTSLDWDLSENTLTIKGTGEMPNYTTSGGAQAIPWYANRNNIEIVTIETGVTNIGNWIFFEHSALKSVTIPSTVTNIGKEAFAGTALDSIRIPGSITQIDSEAFANCKKLAFVKLPPNITKIASDLFHGCDTLTAIDIPSDVKVIEDSAFYKCRNLKSIVIPPGVTSIGARAFKDCSNLKSVVIPQNLAAIGESAFNGCPITYVINQSQAPQDITGKNVFSHSETDTLYVPSASECVNDYKANAAWNEFDTIMIGIDSLTLDIALVDSLLTGDSIQLRCTVWPTDASNKTVTWASSDGTVATVDSGLVKASSDKKGVATITAKTELGGITATCTVRVAKSGDATLDTIIVNKGELTPTFDRDVFSSTDTVETDVDSITIVVKTHYPKATVSSKGVIDTIIRALAFEDNLVEITVTAENGEKQVYTVNVHRRIPEGDFGTNLHWKISEEELTVWNKNTHGNENMPDIDLGQSSSRPYSYWKEIKTAVIGDGIKSIGDLAFYECKALTSVTISDSVESIGMWAFYGCEQLTSVTIPKNVKEIGLDAFSECTNLTYVINQSPTPQNITGKDVFEGVPVEDITLYVPTGRLDAYGNAEVWNEFKPILVPIDSITLDKDTIVHIGDTIRLNATVSPEDADETWEWFSSDNAVASIDASGLVTAKSTGTAYIKFKFTTDNGYKADSCKVEVIMDSDDSTKLSGLVIYTPEGSPLELDPSFYPGTTDYTIKTGLFLVDTVVIRAEAFDSTATVSGTGKHELKYGENSFSVIVSNTANGNTKTYTVNIERATYWNLANGKLSINITGTEETDMPDGYTISDLPPWYVHRRSIREIEIGEEITHIGKYAFYNLDSVKSVSLPAGLKSIGDSAFYHCAALTSVAIPQEVTTIGKNAFDSCTGLESITILKETPPVVEDNVFANIINKNDITLYVLSGSLEAYGADDVWNDFNIVVAVSIDTVSVTLLTGDSVQLPWTTGWPVDAERTVTWESSAPVVATVNETGLVTALNAGRAIISITTTIGKFTDNCTVDVIQSDDATLDTIIVVKSGKLTPVFHPASLNYTDTVTTAVDSITIVVKTHYPKATISPNDTIIRALAFGDNLIPITVTAENGNEQVYTVNVHREIPVGECGAGVTWKYFRGVLTISGSGWINNDTKAPDFPGWYKLYHDSITKIVIGEEVDSIGDGAFRLHEKLTSVSLPDSLKSIGDSVFYHCTALESVTIPQKVTTIGKNAFDSCIGLKSITNLSKAPQTITTNDSVFKDIELNNIKLYVPSGYKPTYKEAPVWEDFGDNIVVAATNVSIDTASVTLLTGDSIQLPWTVWPVDAEKTLTWESSNDAVAVVVGDSGWVKAMEIEGIEGSAIIRVITAIGKSIDSCTVNVIKSDDATLDTIIVNDDVFELTPAFDPDSLHYTVSVEADDGDFSDIKLVVKKHYSKATVSPQPRNDTIIVYASDFGKPVEITVTAENGENKRVYTVNVIPVGACGEGVTWTYSKGVLTISGNGQMQDYTDTYFPEWDRLYRHSITKIVIEEGVENIGNGAFRLHDSLTSVTIPEGVTSIGLRAFSGCSKLTSVTNKSQEPQDISRDVFEGIMLDDITLYVSNGCLAAYREAEVWKEFGTIQVPIDSIVLDQSQSIVALSIGNTIQLTATVYPTPDAAETAGELVWNSSEEKVASVSNSGLVTANSFGNAIIKVRTSDGRFVDSCEVHVNNPTAIIPLTGAPASASVYLNRQVLYIDTPETEQVTVYSVAGILLYRLEKPVGKASFALHVAGSLSNRILIVKGSSGWTGKLIIAN